MKTIEIALPFAGTPDAADSAAIFTSILESISAANLETDPQIRAERMKVIVAAKELDSVLAEIDRALAIEVVGGGLARIDAVEDVVANDISKQSSSHGFQSLFEWTVRASAGHWGHNHRRNLRYRGHVEVVREKGAWKLAGFTVVDTRDVN